jgi:uridine kinase
MNEKTNLTLNNAEELAKYIESKSIDSKRFVIAISGFGGAGKSTTSEKLSALLGNATLIHADDFIASDENGALEGYHLDWEVLEEQAIKKARTADRLISRIYDWGSNQPVFEETSLNKYVIFEGSIWLIQNKFKSFFDLTVWVSVPQDIANARGKKRDNEEYGIDHNELWDNVWNPREKESFDKLQPDANADILLDNDYS